MLRILRLVSLPNLEMKQHLTVDHIHRTQKITGLDLISGLHGCASELAVERKIIAMLNKNALIVTRHDDNLLYYTIKYSTNLCSL